MYCFDLPIMTEVLGNHSLCTSHSYVVTKCMRSCPALSRCSTVSLKQLFTMKRTLMGTTALQLQSKNNEPKNTKTESNQMEYNFNFKIIEKEKQKKTGM